MANITLFAQAIGKLPKENIRKIIREEKNIQPVVKMAATVRAHKPYILAWYDYPISNGPTEGINNKIKVLKRQMYGFRNEEFFTLKL